MCLHLSTTPVYDACVYDASAYARVQEACAYARVQEACAYARVQEGCAYARVYYVSTPVSTCLCRGD